MLVGFTKYIVNSFFDEVTVFFPFFKISNVSRINKFSKRILIIPSPLLRCSFSGNKSEFFVCIAGSCNTKIFYWLLLIYLIIYLLCLFEYLLCLNVDIDIPTSIPLLLKPFSNAVVSLTIDKPVWSSLS